MRRFWIILVMMMGVVRGDMGLLERLLEPYEEKREAKAEGMKEEKVRHWLKLTRVLELLGNHLKNQYEAEGEMVLVAMKDWADLELENEEYEVVFHIGNMEHLKNVIPVNFRVVSGGREIGNWNMVVKCELWRDAYVTREALVAGGELRPEALKVQRMDVLRYGQPVVGVGVELNDYELIRNVQVDRPLYWGAVRKKPDVRKGNVVEVVAEEGGMKITMKGVAMEDGMKNEFILVKNVHSKRNIQAQIVDDNRVRVHF